MKTSTATAKKTKNTKPTAPKLSDQAAVWTSLDELLLWAENPKDHDVADAESSLRRFGFGAPCVGWTKKRMLLVGHGRLKGLRAILEKDPKLAQPENAVLLKSLNGPTVRHVPVRFMDFATIQEAQAYALRDNNPFGAYDPLRLSSVLKSLEGNNVDLSTLGFGREVLAGIMAINPTVLPGSSDDINSSTAGAINGAIAPAHGGATIKTVQLVYSPAEHEQFVKSIEALAGTSNLGPAKLVLDVVVAAAARKKPK